MFDVMLGTPHLRSEHRGGKTADSGPEMEVQYIEVLSNKIYSLFLDLP